MLPFRRRDGISSTYGLDFSGVFVIPENPQDSIDFDRVRFYTDLPRHLEPIKHTFKVHNKGLTPTMREPLYFQTANFDMDDSPDIGANRIHYKWDRHDVKYSSHVDVIDPTRSKMSLIFKNNGSFIVTSKIENGCVLGFSVISNEWNGWDLAGEREAEFQDRINNDVKFEIKDRKIEEFELEDDLELNLQLPYLNFIDSIDLDDEILGLEFLNIDAGSTTLIGVRTRASILVIRLKFVNSKFKMKKLFTLKSDDYWSNFSHLNLHETSDGEILMVVIDVNAKFKLFKLIEGNFQFVNLNFDSFYEPSELSGFKSSFWLSDDRLILYSRSQIHELNLNRNKLKCRVTGGIFSRFLDMQPIPEKEGWIVLLTTKELILIDGTKSFKKRLAWKHYLNHEDKTFYLQVLKAPYENKNIICRIASKATNFNQVIQVNPIELKIIDYPHWCFTHKKAVESSFLMPLSNLSNLFLLIQTTPLNELSSCILKFTSFYDKQEKFGRPFSKRIVKPDYFKFGQLPNEMYFHHISGEMEPVYSQLIDSTLRKRIMNNEDDEAQVAVQAYADKLSEALSQFVEEIQSNISFQQLVEYTGHNININELMDMITELVDHFQTSNIFDFHIHSDLWKADIIMKQNIPFINIDALKNIYKNFLPLLKTKEYQVHLAQYIGFHLILSSIAIQKREIDTDQLDLDFENNCNKLTEDQRNMLKEFEDDMDVTGQFINFDDGDDKEDKKKTILDVPTVAISQSQKRTSTPMASQIYTTNSSQPALSLGSSSQKKTGGSKKKKRRTGF